MYNVVIADDEPWVVYGLQRLIPWEENGFTVCGTASNGEEALDKCLSLKPDVLFTDIRMPGLNGIALLESLKAQMPNIEVIFISGYSEFEYAQKAVRYGAADYLIKKVTAKQLIESCERLKIKLEEKNHRVSDPDSFALLALLDEDFKLKISEWIKQEFPGCPSRFYRMVTLTGTLDPSAINTPEINCSFIRTGRDKLSILTAYSDTETFDEWLNVLHLHKEWMC